MEDEILEDKIIEEDTIKAKQVANHKQGVVISSNQIEDMDEPVLDRGRIQNKIPLHPNAEITSEDFDSRIKLIAHHSKILNPHIVEQKTQNENLTIDGELQVVNVSTYKSKEDLMKDFSPQQLSRLREKFNR